MVTASERKDDAMRAMCFAVAALAAVLLAGMAPGAQQRAKHVVLVACDGWGAYSVRKADPATIPNIRALMGKGAWTLKDRSVLPSSSAINWASMFMGVPTELHGYTQWNSQKPEIKPNLLNEHGIAPTIFSELRRQRPEARIDVVAEWGGIGHLIDRQAVDSYFLVPGKYEETPNAIVDEAVRLITEKKPTLLAVCIDQLDHVGHAQGHDTPAYYKKLAQIDGYVGRILKAIDEAGMAQDTVVILTADHGGVKKGHGGKSLAEMEIPFILAGPAIKPVGEFEAAMMQYDCAAVIADLLGVEPPAGWRGRAYPQLLR